MERFTLGVLLSEDLKRVVLILKNRPEWQAGLYNFPGGKIEPEEDVYRCVSREFFEECGATINPEKWTILGEITDNTTYSVVVLHTRGDYKILTMEDQKVDWFQIDSLPSNLVYHLEDILKDSKEFYE